MSTETPRFHVGIRERHLECDSEDGRTICRMPVEAIVLIAEYTSDEGPWSDDHFLVFWSFENGRLFRSIVPDSFEGMDQTIADLSQCLQVRLELGLLGETTWISRVLWPPELAGHPYFTFVEIETKTWMDRVKKRLIGPAYDCFPSDEVVGFLRRRLPRKRQRSRSLTPARRGFGMTSC
jgi:hypothetical protein